MNQFHPDYLPNEHPGRMLLEDYLEPLGITPYRVAKNTGLSPIHVSEIIKGKRNITATTSLLLGKLLGMSEGFWLNLQTRYDLIEARRGAADRLEKIQPLTTVAV